MDRLENYIQVILIILSTLIVFSFINSGDDTEKIQQGKHWKIECKMLETNIDHGFFSDKKNRLDCGGVIENVKAEEYQAAINAYADSLTTAKSL